VAERSIDLVSRSNFFLFPYGRGAPGKMTGCVFIRTHEWFGIVGYNQDKRSYVLWHRIPYQNVECSVYERAGPGSGMCVETRGLLGGQFARTSVARLGAMVLTSGG
jgi:hypothetical protein